MYALRNIARRLIPEWTPGRITLAIVSAALIVGLLPFVKMSLIVDGVFLGAIIALGASGLTLIYGVLNLANIAHGDYMTMGAYVALFLLTGVFPAFGIAGEGLGPLTFGYPLLIALPLAAAVVAVMATFLDVAIYRRLRQRGVNAVVLGLRPS